MDRMQIIVLILFIAGAFIPVMCLIKMRMLKNFKRNAVVSAAEITHAERRVGPKGAVYYMLAVTYEDQSGNIFRGQAVGAKKNVPGTTIPIMYKPDDPSKYKTDFGKYLPTLLIISLLLFGAICWLCYWLLTREYTIRPD